MERPSEPDKAARSGVMLGMAVAIHSLQEQPDGRGRVMNNSNQTFGTLAHSEGSKVVDLASFRRDRSVDNWVLVLSAVGFCVLSGMFAAKVATLLGAGGLHAVLEWVR